MTSSPLEHRAADAARACARAEFEKWSAVLDLREQMVDEIEADATAMFRCTAINAVCLEIAQLLKISEQQVWRIAEQSRRLRDRAPRAWTAFADGLFDAQKAATISAAIERCTETETVGAFELPAIEYATGHTNAELKRWLNKLIDRLEPPDLDEAEAQRAKRSVVFDGTHLGMSQILAYVPTPAAVAIRKRLRAAARAIDDDRTQQQKEADLLCSWLTNATGTECDITAEIAVLVEAKALAGVTDVPAHVLDIDGDVTRIGYQPPESLRKAVQWRDRRCRVSGCNKPAEATDLDHRIPFDRGGPTNGSNLWCLCRRHHGMKGHDLLSKDAYDPPEVHLVRLPRPPIRVDYIPAA